MPSAIALCLTGWQHTAIPKRGDYLRSHVLDPLGADILLLLTYRRTEMRCDHVKSCDLLQRTARLQPITSLAFEQMPTISELLQHLESLPHWNTILRAFNSSRHWHHFHSTRRHDGKVFLDMRRPRNVSCVRQAWGEGDERKKHVLGGWSTPYICDDAGVGGATIFAPIIGPTSLNILWQLHAQQRLLALIRTTEERRKAAYLRIIVSRLDYVWLASHPPLTLLPERCAWVPLGED
jgi:hypothetical protein